MIRVALAALGSVLGAGLLSAQTPQVTPPGKTERVVMNFVVTAPRGHFVEGLKIRDFRVTEDGIVQRIAWFSENTAVGAGPNGGDEAFYTVTYDPDPSNRNPGFRKVNIEIVTDPEKRYRVRARPGYRPAEVR